MCEPRENARGFHWDDGTFVAKSFRWWCCGLDLMVEVTGICGSMSTAYQPAFFVLYPAPHALLVIVPAVVATWWGKVAEPLSQGKYPKLWR
jgi:hypothetical protein